MVAEMIVLVTLVTGQSGGFMIPFETKQACWRARTGVVSSQLQKPYVRAVRTTCVDTGDTSL